MSRATRCSLRYKTRTVVFLYVTPFIWRKYQNIKWASILSLWWIEDLMMSFERTEETRSPELAPEASVALSGSSCESPVQCCYIHTIAFLNCLQPDCFQKVHVFKLVLASIRNWVSLHLFSCAAFTKPTSSRPLLFSDMDVAVFTLKGPWSPGLPSGPIFALLWGAVLFFSLPLFSSSLTYSLHCTVGHPPAAPKPRIP